MFWLWTNFKNWYILASALAAEKRRVAENEKKEEKERKEKEENQQRLEKEEISRKSKGTIFAIFFWILFLPV